MVEEAIGLSKEAFIFETIVQLIHAKNIEIEHGFIWGTKIGSIGWDKDNPKKFKIHKKTMWQAIKTLEKEGYIRRDKHDIYFTDEAWEPIKKNIIKFHIIKKTKDSPPVPDISNKEANPDKS